MLAIADREVYLSRMAKPLQEKLKVREYIPQNAARVLDVGCADGTVTLALAKLYPQTHFVGIDFDKGFVAQANAHAAEHGIRNAEFRNAMMWQFHDEPERFDAALFVSVLHEIWTYGGQMPGVMRAIAGACHLLVPGGRIIIRDMVPWSYRYHMPVGNQALHKVRSNADTTAALADFERMWGPIQTQAALNHFLLKYMYRENWERECKEHYIPVDSQQYRKMFEVLGMKILYDKPYLIPYLHDLWQRDFGLTDEETKPYVSTRIMVAQKQ